MNPDNWRLRLQTSGIYRVSAIPGCNVKVKVKTSGSAAGAASRPGLAPEVSAQVASLQSLTLCSGQAQRRPAIAGSSSESCLQTTKSQQR
jgi:hypothetical protein